MALETNIDEVILDFQANMTGVDLTGKEPLIWQAFLRSLAICRKTINASLDIELDIEPYTGVFTRKLGYDEIALIAAGMTAEWYKMEQSRVALERNYMGTRHFDKSPNRKQQYEGMRERSDYWDREFYRLRNEFYEYKG